MRIRSTKPEFWRSERIASVPWDVRLVLKGLESYVDDNGVGKDDLALIVADVFPRDLSRSPTGTLRKVSEALDQLSEAGLLWRYEADDTRLLYISFWETTQRIEKPSKGRYPRPDGTFEYRESIIRAPLPEYSGSVPVALRPGTGEQGNRGTGEQTLSFDLSNARFDEFWNAYPRHQAKAAAVKAFEQAVKRADVEKILDGAKRYRDDPNREPQFTALPATWLNQDRWTDDPLPPRNVRPLPNQNLDDPAGWAR